MSAGRLRSLERVLALHHGTFVWRSQLASDVPVPFDRPEVAVSWLRRGSADAGGHQALRAALDSIGGSADLGRVGRADLERRLGVALSRHRIVAVRAADTRVEADLPEELVPEVVVSREKREELTWIAIRMVDDGEPPQPASHARYRITLADGTTREGTLDAEGYARIDGIDPGQCKVTFPDLHAADWRKA